MQPVGLLPQVPQEGQVGMAAVEVAVIFLDATQVVVPGATVVTGPTAPMAVMVPLCLLLPLERGSRLCNPIPASRVVMAGVGAVAVAEI